MLIYIKRGTFNFNDVLNIGANSILTSQETIENIQFDDVCSLFFTSVSYIISNNIQMQSSIKL